MRVATVAAVYAAFAGCSPSMFWSDGKDPSIENARNYRKVNPDCAGLSLSSSTMDAVTARGLIGCFNSYGAIDEFSRLAKRLDNTELQAILDVGNKYILNNEKLMFQLERTFNDLSQAGILDESLDQLGKLLENAEFVAAAVALLKEGYTARDERPWPVRMVQPRPPRAEMEVLKALEILSQKLSPESVADGIDYALSFAGARSFEELLSRFHWDAPAACDPKNGQPDPAQCSLSGYTNAVLAYLKDTGDDRKVDAGREVMARILDDTLFTAMEEVIGNDPENIRTNVARMASVMNVTLADNADIMQSMTSLFRYLNGPIHCMKGAKSVPNGVMYVIREMTLTPTKDIATFLQKTNRLMLQTMNSLCEYPPELATYYPGMVKLADHMAVQPATDMIKSFYRVKVRKPDGTEERPLADFLVRMLSDTGATNATGIKRLLPLMSAVSERKPWEDLLLVVSLLRKEDQSTLKSIVSFVSEARPELAGKSVYDVLSGALTRTSPQNVFRLLYSLRHFVDEKKPPILMPALKVLRQAFYINDSSPLVDTIRRSLAEATQNEASFNVMFKIAEYPEFRDTVAMLSRMARRNDGQLKSLLTAVVSLFHNFAQKGKSEIHATIEPPFVPKRRHDFVAADLVAFPDVPPPSEAPEACRLLDPRVSLAEPGHPDFNRQMDALLACINYGDNYLDVLRSMAFLRSTPLDTGELAFNKIIGLIKGLPLNRDQVGLLADKWIQAVDDGPFFNMIRSSVFLFGRVPGIDGPVMRPLFDVVRPIVNRAWDAWKRLEDYGASLVQKDNTLRAVQYALDLYDVAVPAGSGGSCGSSSGGGGESPFEPRPSVPPVAIDRQLLGHFVEAKECVSRPNYVPVSFAHRERRVDEMLADYHDAVNDWELVNGQARKSYDLATFRERLEPVLNKMADPSQSHYSKHVIDAMLNLVRYFSLEPGQKPTRTAHFQRSYLLQWLHERANDPRVISYFYPGENAPRVRVVNSLDRLDLVLTEAARTPIPLLDQNLGIKFLKEIGEAWGDEPKSSWPEEIYFKYNKTTPKTLRAAVTEMLQSLSLFETLAGFPDRPMCPKSPDPRVPDDYHIPGIQGDGGLAGWIPDSLAMKSSIHNIRAVMSVLLENLPDSGHPMAGGIKVLRNLFYELYYSTPLKDRCNTDANGRGEETTACYQQKNLTKNNLWVILETVKLGLTRGASRLLQGTDINDPSLQDFMNTLVDGSNAPEMRKILDRLVGTQKRGRELFWKVLDQLFTTIDQAKGLEIPRLKQMVFYSLSLPAEIARALPLESRDGAYVRAHAADVTRRFLQLIWSVLDENSEYLAEHADLIGDVLKSAEASWMARAVYQDQSLEGKREFAVLFDDFIRDPARARDGMSLLKAIDADPQAKASWDVFTTRWDKLKVDPSYCALKMGDITRDIVHFLAGKDSTPLGRETAAQLRNYFADRMQSGDIDSFLRLAANKPEEFFSVLETVAHYSDTRGDLWQFAQLARRALSEVK